MLVPYSWLKNFLNLRKPVEQVAADLSLSTIGVEGIREIGKEKVLNLDVTYNRGDLLSIVGVARELAALYKLELKNEGEKFDPPASLEPLKIKWGEKLARIYTLTKVSNLSYKATPDQIKKRLETAGMRPVNLWVDITNYVMLEYGQPFHAFDAEKVARRDPTLSIQIRRAKEGERLKTLDGTDRRLIKSDTVIADRAGPLALAGVMGGEDTEVDEGTKEILLEAAIFDPISIRKTARRLGLRSEASNRFEHILSPENLSIALHKVIQLLQLHGRGEVTGFSSLGRTKTRLPSIVLTLEKLTAIAGEPVPLTRARECLERLGFKVMSSEKGLLCWPPYFRSDIKIPEDLAEEVLRLHGYENIPAKPIETCLSQVEENKLEQWRDTVTYLLANLGFHEVKRYPFVSTQVLSHFKKEELLHLRNPISTEAEYLRPTLLFSLLEFGQQNAPRQEQGRIFELEKIYPKEGESLNLGALVWGEKDSLLTLKGILETICRKAHLDIEFSRAKDQFLHPAKAMEIRVGKEILGTLGIIHPHLGKAFGLPAETTVLELNFEKFVEGAEFWGSFTPVSPYPEIYEDFSFIIPEKYSLGKLLERVEQSSPLIREVKIIDRYQETGKRSITIRVTFQSNEKGLSVEEIKPVRKKIQALIRRGKGILRS